MSLHSFMCAQRRKMVVMIFDSLLAKYQRFTQVMHYAEDVANKNQQNPEDDSVDSSLRHLKGLLQFNNSDSIAQIDLALEQSDMASLYSLQKPRPSFIVLDQQDDTTTQIMQDEIRDKSLLPNRNTVIPVIPQQSPITPKKRTNYVSEDNHPYQRQQQQQQQQQPQQQQQQQQQRSSSSSSKTTPLTSILKTPPPPPAPLKVASPLFYKTIITNISKKHPETHFVSSHSIVPAKKLPFINSDLLFSKKQGDKQSFQKKTIKHRVRSARHDGNHARNRSILSKATFFTNEFEEAKFREYMEALIEFEDNYQIRITSRFKDKNFFFLRTQNDTLPIMSVLDSADKDMILQMTPHFQTQKGVADLLNIKPHLVSTIIAASKKTSYWSDGERNTSKSTNETDHQEDQENEEEEEHYYDEDEHSQETNDYLKKHNNSCNNYNESEESNGKEQKFKQLRKHRQSNIEESDEIQLNDDQSSYQYFHHTKIEPQDTPPIAKTSIKQKE